MRGKVTFLTITCWPATEMATFLALIFCSVSTWRMAAATALLSMMSPSTMASNGRGAMPSFWSRYRWLLPLPRTLSSQTFTELDPMSRPTS